MAIMTNIDITHNPTKPELYNRIFAGESGIFDRFFDGENEYSEGSQIMRDPKNIRKYLEFLRNIAFNMFERHEFFVTKGEYQMPKLEFQRRQISILEFPIKHFFEGTKNKIEFIHKSIYES